MGYSLFAATAILSLLFMFSFISEVQSTSFRIVNKCRYTVWPGILTGADRTVLTPTGFTLKSGKSKTITAPKSWSGRLWGRTLCSTDSTGKFYCVTGDCGSGKIECAGSGAIPPATLAEFTLNGDAGLDFYDVSLVDGYNLPMLVLAKGGERGRCSSTGCLVDLNGACPAELRVARGNGTVGVSRVRARVRPLVIRCIAVARRIIRRIRAGRRCTRSILSTPAPVLIVMLMMTRPVPSLVPELITLLSSAQNLSQVKSYWGHEKKWLICY